MMKSSEFKVICFGYAVLRHNNTIYCYSHQPTKTDSHGNPYSNGKSFVILQYTDTYSELLRRMTRDKTNLAIFSVSKQLSSVTNKSFFYHPLERV